MKKRIVMASDEEYQDTETTLAEKIRDLFHICDKTNKGYVTRKDLYRLKDELGLTDHDVENAFDQLDTDKDNILTMKEFTTGFGLFLGLENPPTTPINTISADFKPDFAFQVFNLIDKEDKGYITKENLYECTEELEINPLQIDYIYSRLKTHTGEIYFDDFVLNMDYVVALSAPLQEIKKNEENTVKSESKKETVTR